MREAMKYCDFVVVVCTYVESKCDRCGTDLGEEHGPWADEEQSLWRLKVGWNDLADKEQVFDMLASGWYNRGADTSWSEDSPIWNYRNPNQLTLQEVQ